MGKARLGHLDESHLDALRSLGDLSFGGVTSDEQWQVILPTIDLTRSTGVFDGDDLVCHSGIDSLALALPGGVPVRAAGITAVMAHPAHRRRGHMRRLLEAQLADLHAQGEPLAILWASEPAIYGPFGFAPASSQVRMTAPRGARLRPWDAGRPTTSTHARQADLALDVVDITQEALQACAQAYQRAATVRPLMPSRTGSRWTHDAYDGPEERAGGASALRCLLVSDADGPVGYSWYRVKIAWSGARPNGEVVVHETVAATPAAEARMLAFLLDVDLTETVHWWNLPTDHAALALIEDLRPCQPAVVDQIWARPIRLDEVLATRRYRVPVDVVLEVADQACPWNAGRWRLAGDASGATCTATTAPADLRADVREVAAALLGAGTLPAAMHAGLVEELTPGAVGAVATAFATLSAPWCAFIF